jgi:hypothetical protein
MKRQRSVSAWQRTKKDDIALNGSGGITKMELKTINSMRKFKQDRQEGVAEPPTPWRDDACEVIFVDDDNDGNDDLRVGNEPKDHVAKAAEPLTTCRDGGRVIIINDHDDSSPPFSNGSDDDEPLAKRRRIPSKKAKKGKSRSRLAKGNGRNEAVINLDYSEHDTDDSEYDCLGKRKKHSITTGIYKNEIPLAHNLTFAKPTDFVKTGHQCGECDTKDSPLWQPHPERAGHICIKCYRKYRKDNQGVKLKHKGELLWSGPGAKNSALETSKASGGDSVQSLNALSAKGSHLEKNSEPNVGDFVSYQTLLHRYFPGWQQILDDKEKKEIKHAIVKWLNSNVTTNVFNMAFVDDNGKKRRAIPRHLTTDFVSNFVSFMSKYKVKYVD